MECLSPNNISIWIRHFGLIEDPRHSSNKCAHHLTFSAPSNYNYQAFECFWECIIAEIFVSGELLIVVTDTGPSIASQDFILDAIRQTTSEKRPLLEVPGFKMASDERMKAVALLSLMGCFGWKCYLYGSHGQATLFNWEGKILDFWTNSESERDGAMRVIRNFGLSLSRENE